MNRAASPTPVAARQAVERTRYKMRHPEENIDPDDPEIESCSSAYDRCMTFTYVRQTTMGGTADRGSGGGYLTQLLRHHEENVDPEEPEITSSF